MPTLHIEHPITDFDTWKSAFDRFAPARESAGVRHHRVQRPVDDPAYIVVNLDFDEVPTPSGSWASCRRRCGPRPRRHRLWPERPAPGS